MAEPRTFYDDVLPLFTDMDIECMASRPSPVLLASYDWWSEDNFANYDRVLGVVTSGRMPLGGPRWEQASIDVLVAWKDGGFQRGTEPVDPPEEEA
jgi:hypothetical protein